MDHLEFAAAESAALKPTTWEQWVKRAELILGHSLDGNQSSDGYSMDYAYAAWKRGTNALAYVNSIRH